MDFETGFDDINLSAIDANTQLAGDQGFFFAAEPWHFSGQAGELIITGYMNGGWFIQGDTNGDGSGDLGLIVYNAPGTEVALENFDFILGKVRSRDAHVTATAID